MRKLREQSVDGLTLIDARRRLDISKKSFHGLLSISSLPPVHVGLLLGLDIRDVVTLFVTVLVEVRIRLRCDALDLGNRHHGDVPKEDQEQRQEEPERARKSQYVYPGWREVTPTGRQIIAVERRDDDHEPLKPHPDVHEDGDHEHQGDIAPQLLEPEDLRGNEIA